MMRSKALALTASAVLFVAGLSLPRIFAQEPPPTGPPGSTPPPEQAPEVTLELNRGQRPPMKLAMPPFRGTQTLSGAAAGAAREMEQTVRRDLESSGYFEIIGPDRIGAVKWSGDMQRDVEPFRALGAETLLLGDIRAEGDRIVFEGRLFDIASAQPILAKRYRGSITVSRRIGHTFADEVIRYLVGRPGISQSSIAFTSDRSGHKEIWVMDYDGQNQRRITGHQSTSMSPAWSPSGDALAYTSFFNGPPSIYVADMATNRKQPVVTSGSMNTTPSFSPDGSRVAFARSVEGNVEIFSTDRTGKGMRRLTHSNAIDTNPAWSPRGSQIAFTSGRGGNPHIYVMDPEGTDQRRLTFDGDYNDGASWSPEGDLVVYSSRRGGRFQIAVTNVVTLATRVLTSGPGDNEAPTFSPDARKIAFVSRRSGRKQIYVMDVTGGNVQQVTQEGNNDMPDWSRIPVEP